MMIKGSSARGKVPLFEPLFYTSDACEDFLELCVGINDDPDDTGEEWLIHNIARNVISQTCAIISLADQTESKILKLVLLMTLAESVACVVLPDNRRGSRRACHRFFEQLCCTECSALLPKLLTSHYDVAGAVDILYDERCKAVHEGRLSSPFLGTKFIDSMNNHDDETIVYQTIRHIVLGGCIRGARHSFDLDCYADECPGHNGEVKLRCDASICTIAEVVRNALIPLSEDEKEQRLQQTWGELFKAINKGS